MKYRLPVFLCLFFLPVKIVQGQKNDTLESNTSRQKTIYSFIIQDSPARLFTMRQFDQDYLSGYRFYSNLMKKNFSPALNYIIQAVTHFFVLGDLTHEEGHRSILISKNIGSISQPFFLSKRGGYIDGVTDSTLKNLMRQDFPDYARLHTAGLESDYMLTHREEEMIAFGKETYSNLAIEYLLRKAMIMEYFLMGFFKYDIDGAEEKDELKRDIVGNDVYGVIRHLHRPGMTFHRYTRYDDLTAEEISYLKKMGFRSFFNLVNLNMIGIPNIRVSDNLRINFGMGHTMCPFGDFIDENLWVKYKDKLKIDAYFRQFQNREKWFLAGGIGIKDYPLSEKLYSTVDFHVWDQPVNLGFNDRKGKLGAAVQWVGRYFIIANKKTKLGGVSGDLGLIYKTYGFLPEEIEMKKHFGIQLGTSLALDKQE
jgi:hypothetical protein